MVRHMGRDIVKFGHWDEYVAPVRKDPEFLAALTANLSHVVDGESRDYVLSEVVE